jgi:hypothetical protein
MNKNRKYSFISARVKRLIPNTPVLVKIPLKKYCQQRNITRKQAKTLLNKRWLTASKVRGRIYVAEICPEAINAWFDVWG